MNNQDCATCGTPHTRCAGHKRLEDGGRRPCNAWPIRGGRVCQAHGGSAPQVKAKAAARRAEQKARDDVERYGGSREVDPATALLEEVHRSAATVEYLRRRVNDLDEDDLTWGIAEDSAKDGPKLKAAPNPLVKLYQEERRHLAQVCKAAIDAGVSERVVAVYEQIAASYMQVLERVLDDLELTVEQRRRVPDVVQTRLRAIAGTAA